MILFLSSFDSPLLQGLRLVAQFFQRFVYDLIGTGRYSKHSANGLHMS